MTLVDQAEVRKARTSTSVLLLGIIHTLGVEGSELHEAGDDAGAAQVAVACASLLDCQEWMTGLDA